MQEDSLQDQIAEASNESNVPDGVFWSDHIKTLRNRPIARLACALKHRPLPGAYREGLVALRALIRAKRKTGESWDAELARLYQLAAEEAFLYSDAYEDSIGLPSYNVAEGFTLEELDLLAFPYADVGFEEVGSLSVTDVKWIKERWGLPRNHQDPRKLHLELWKATTNKVKAELEVSKTPSWGELDSWDETLNDDPHPPVPASRSEDDSTKRADLASADSELSTKAEADKKRRRMTIKEVSGTGCGCLGVAWVLAVIEADGPGILNAALIITFIYIALIIAALIAAAIGRDYERRKIADEWDRHAKESWRNWRTKQDPE